MGTNFWQTWYSPYSTVCRPPESLAIFVTPPITSIDDDAL